MPPNTTRTIKVIVDTKGAEGLKNIAASMGQVSRNTKSLAGNLSFITNAFSGFVGALGIREIVSLSDEMQNLNSRLIVITGSADGAKIAMAGLNQIAKDNNAAINDTALIYSRLGVSLKNTTIGQDQLLRTTKLLQNAYRLSGSTAEEQTGSIIQLSQAFSRGALRGQELNSVLSGSAVIANALRKEYGANLFKEAEKGAITTAKVFKILFEEEQNINEEAKKLTPTIGQSLTKAFNSLKVAIFELNQETDASGNFAKFIDLLIGKLPVIATVIGALALTQIPLLIGGLVKLGLALKAFALGNPVTAVFLAIGLAVIYVYDNFEQLKNSAISLKNTFFELISPVNDFFKVIADATGISALARGIEFLTDGLKGFFRSTKAEAVDANGYVDDLSKGAKDLVRSFKPGKDAKFLKDLNSSFQDTSEKVKKQRDILAELNIEYNKQTITATQYADALAKINLDKLNKDFAEGRVNLQAYTQQYEALTRIELNKSINDNVISFTEFNKRISESKIRELNRDLEQGKISVIEFDQQIVKTSDKFLPGSSLRAGVSGYLESVGTTSQQVAGAIQNAFGGLENVLTDFIFKGKASFADFTKAILDDLSKIIISASIIQPLAQGILNLGSSGSNFSQDTANVGGTQAFSGFAKGGAFDKGLTKFASGGVVNSPTTFGYGKGKTGLMGEAGPEAILPLSRTSGGGLGVSASVTPVTINIMNQNGSEVQATEKTGPNGEKSIEVLITNKVRESVANGSLDRVFSQSYGLTRKGS